MDRILFGVLLFIHGVIHIIGFTTEWGFGPKAFPREKTLMMLSENAAKISGVIWLITSALWLAAAITYLLRNDTCWKIALTALIVSQVLILLYWPFAKFGTIVNVFVFVIVVLNLARINFDKNVEREWSALREAAGKNQINQNGQADLPSVVAKWLSVTKSQGAIPARVIVKQEGAMRSKPGANWMTFSASQYYTLYPPAFAWDSRISAAPMITIAGRDKFENGKGNMLIKPLYIYRLANAKGEEIDQGTILRFMGEVIWFPEAVAMEYFHWKEIDASKAELSMTYKGTTAKGVFTFDADGLVKSFSAERFGDFDGHFRKEIWEVKVLEYSWINGHLLGSKCEVIWKLKEGDFTWLKLEVKDVRYEMD